MEDHDHDATRLTRRDSLRKLGGVAARAHGGAAGGEVLDPREAARARGCGGPLGDADDGASYPPKMLIITIPVNTVRTPMTIRGVSRSR